MSMDMQTIKLLVEGNSDAASASLALDAQTAGAGSQDRAGAQAMGRWNAAWLGQQGSSLEGNATLMNVQFAQAGLAGPEQEAVGKTQAGENVSTYQEHQETSVQQLRQNYRDHQAEGPARQTDSVKRPEEAAEQGSAMSAMKRDAGREQAESQAQPPEAAIGAAGALPAPAALQATENAPLLASASNSAEQDLHTLLENACQSIYLQSQAGGAGLNNIVLDIGNVLPGALVEIRKQAGSLQVRLFAADLDTLGLMQKEREDLASDLSALTRQQVRVEAVFRGNGQGQA
jgi:hypothetical protein